MEYNPTIRTAELATVITGAQKARDDLLEAWRKLFEEYATSSEDPVVIEMRKADRALLSLMDIAFSEGINVIPEARRESEKMDADNIAQAVADAIETQFSQKTGGNK